MDDPQKNIAYKVRAKLLKFIDFELFSNKKKQIEILINSKTSEEITLKYSPKIIYQTIKTEVFSNDSNDDSSYLVSISVNQSAKNCNISTKRVKHQEITDLMKRIGIYYIFDKKSRNKTNKINGYSIEEILKKEEMVNKKIKLGYKKIKKNIQNHKNTYDDNKIKNNNISLIHVKNKSKYNLIKLEKYCNTLINIKQKKKILNDDNNNLTRNGKKKKTQDQKVPPNTLNINNKTETPTPPKKQKYALNLLIPPQKESPNKIKNLIKNHKKVACKIRKFNSILDGKKLKSRIASNNVLSPDIKNLENKKDNLEILSFKKEKKIKFLSPKRSNSKYEVIKKNNVKTTSAHQKKNNSPKNANKKENKQLKFHPFEIKLYSVNENKKNANQKNNKKKKSDDDSKNKLYSPKTNNSKKKSIKRSYTIKAPKTKNENFEEEKNDFLRKSWKAKKTTKIFDLK